MKEHDKHFWIKDVVNRLPIELLPKIPTWPALLTAITQLKNERNNTIARCAELETAIRETIEDNLHLADGENCTLIKLKKAIGYE